MHYMGKKGRARDGSLVDPQMKSHVATEERKDAEIMKEKRKLMEEIRLKLPTPTPPNPKFPPKTDPNKGDGKGKKGQQDGGGAGGGVGYLR